MTCFSRWKLMRSWYPNLPVLRNVDVYDRSTSLATLSDVIMCAWL